MTQIHYVAQLLLYNKTKAKRAYANTCTLQ